jgi:hypothetical protein
MVKKTFSFLIFFYTFIIGAQAQVMGSQIIKTALKRVGTAFGLSLSIGPSLKPIAKYIQDQRDDKATVTTRKPSAQEEAFLRQYIHKDAVIRISSVPNISKADRKTVIISEEISGYPYILSSALVWDDSETKKAFAAIAQHENAHFIHNHAQKRVATTCMPFISTALVGTGFKKLFPFKNQTSFFKHVRRFGIKMLGGAALGTVNLVSYILLFSALSQTQENIADQDISSENRAAFLRYLQADDKDCTDTEQHRNSVIAFIDRKARSHPSVKEREKRLLNKAESPLIKNN